DLSDVISRGWYLSGVWNAVRARGKDREGWFLGDVDLAVRFDRLMFGSANKTEPPFLNPRADNVAPIGKDSWTFGATWLINRWVKVQTNTVREQIVDPLQLLSIGATPLWSTVVRFQVAM
ncbi:MAG: hypothetical protein ACRD2A_09220, partial [Vicinamibacterales bacterium]